MQGLWEKGEGPHRVRELGRMSMTESCLHAVQWCACRSCGDRVRAAPGKAVGADEHGEELLAGPQLQGLHQRGLRQVHSVHAVAHEAGKLRHLRAAVEAVFARKQECRRQEVLRMSDCP